MNKTKKSIYIIIGDDNSINNFFKAVDILGNVKNLKIQKVEYNGCDLISNLTSYQKKILNLAAKFGYYDYPRKITSEEIAEKIGINKDIILENLRKSEKHIITKVLTEK